MTNRDRLISLLGFQPSKESVDGEMIDKGVNGSATYDSVEAVKLKRCAISLMEILLTTPDQTNDVGLVIKYDRPSLLRLQKQYKIDVGDDVETGPRILNKPMW